MGGNAAGATKGKDCQKHLQVFWGVPGRLVRLVEIVVRPFDSVLYFPQREASRYREAVVPTDTTLPNMGLHGGHFLSSESCFIALTAESTADSICKANS
jgi:hypothetical protein